MEDDIVRLRQQAKRYEEAGTYLDILASIAEDAAPRLIATTAEAIRFLQVFEHLKAMSPLDLTENDMEHMGALVDAVQRKYYDIYPDRFIEDRQRNAITSWMHDAEPDCSCFVCMRTFGPPDVRPWNQEGYQKEQHENINDDEASVR